MPVTSRPRSPTLLLALSVALASCTSPATPVTADELLAGCPDQAALDSIRRDFLLTFEEDPTANEPMPCPGLTRFQKRVYGSLLALRELVIDGPLPWTQDPPYTWIRAKITGIHFGAPTAGEGGSCCSPDGAIAISATPGNCLIAGPASDGFVNPPTGCGVGDFWALIVHEARHADGKFHECEWNDNTIAELGAWGVEYHFYRALAEHSGKFLDASEGPGVDYYRETAAAAARDLCSTRFCRDSCPSG